MTKDTEVGAYPVAPSPTNGVDAACPDPRDWLAAIIDGSEDAIVSKNLDGIIQSWNAGAARLFGYTADEVVGKSVTILIPPDRLEEEPMILSQIHQGNRVEHFETKRRRKDGSLIDISLTISPIRNANGVIVGASKIARDITERVIAHQQQQLLMGEMQHRVKNLFTLANAIVTISARSTAREADVLTNIQARLSSLARAHDLILSDRLQGPENDQQVSLLSLVQTILRPYATDDRVSIRGNDCEISGKSIPNLALLLHELATNAAKHGALSAAAGRIDVEISTAADDRINIIWRETGGPEPAPGGPAGFGSRLERGLASALGATIDRDWPETGLIATISIRRQELCS